MAMEPATRHYKTNWNHDRGDSENFSFDIVHSILLQEIRDELRNLNRLLGCGNFLDVPAKLDRIVKNTTRKRKGVAHAK